MDASEQDAVMNDEDDFPDFSTPAWVAPLYFASTAKLNSAYIAVSPFGRAWNKTRTAPSGSDPIAAGRRCPGGWIGWRRPKFP